MLEQKLLSIPLQLGTERIPELPDVPLILDLTDDPKEKAALRLIFSRQTMARPFAAPPGLSPERVKVLRDAFDATMKDPAFLADMARQKLEVRPVPGAKLDQDSAAVAGMSSMTRPDLYDYIGMGIVALLIALWVAHFVLPPLPPEPPDPAVKAGSPFGR
jgi:hypothetical protein